MVVLAVKPKPWRRRCRRSAVPGPRHSLSFHRRGTTLAVFERHLGDRAAIIRAMPNTPAAVGRGISAYCGNAAATEAQKDLAARCWAPSKRGGA